jgi:ADP-ribose pyrophosphatase YjhB (NUDIX family)
MNRNIKFTCKTPITSYGVIHINYSRKYLMICRKNTLGFVDFMRGRYSLQNPHYIMNLIDEMTLSEKEAVVNKTFGELSTWGNYDDVAKDRFTTLQAGMITTNGEFVSTKSLVAQSETRWTTPEWGFPKGRRNAYESEINCALREYDEETGYDRHKLELLVNIMPFEEIFTGSNYKSYIHKYFVGLGNSTPTRGFQESEVGDLKWFTYEQAMDAIRPYNVERKKVLSHVHEMLQKHVTF